MTAPHLLIAGSTGQIGRAQGMQSAPPTLLKLTNLAARHEEARQQLVHCHGLRPGLLTSLVQWPYADYAFSTQWDVIFSMDKARRFGFPDRVDSRRMWVDVLAFFTR
jgi:hypothetical protein